MSKLKIGIIGAGRIGKVHAQAITYHIPEAEVVAISDIREEGLAELAATLGIPSYTTDYHDILNNPEVEAVLVCSSTDTHADISIEAAAAGKHIFCEKPVDLTPAKVKAALAATEKAGVKMQVGFNRRFDANFAKVRELADAGKLGNLEIVRITSRDPAPPPAEYAAVSGGMFLDMTIHDFDMARFLSGSEVTEVYVQAACLVDPAIGEAGDVDTAIVTLTFESGAIGVIDNSRRAAYGYDQRVELFGSKGSASAANETPTQVTLMDADGVTTDKPLYFFLERYMQSFTEELKQFVSAIRKGTPLPVVGNDGLQALLIGLAAKKSVAEKRAVKISEIQ